MGKHQLTAHPARLPHSVVAVEVDADIRAGVSVLVFRVTGVVPAIPAPAAPARTDGLWQHTCFELFVKPAASEGYYEFNFSPSSQWAAYRFDGYREGMADLPLAPPAIEPIEAGIRVTIDLGDLPAGPWRVALTAVIEERDGTKSYWALNHPGGAPDFHHPDCFALELPAPERP